MRKAAIFIRPQSIFLMLALVFGSVFVVLTPPWQVPDEHAHYMRAYTVAEGKLYIGASDVFLEQADASVQSMKRFIPLIGKADEKISLGTLVDEWRMPPANAMGTILFTLNNNAYIYNPVPYLMSAATVHLAVALDLSPVGGLWLARFANLCLWSALVALAIAVIPVFKYELLFIALLPMSLFQGMGMSADSLVNALSFLCFASVVRVLHSSPAPVKRVTLGIASVATFLVAISKQIYAWPYVLLLCQKRGERWYWRFVLGVLVLSILGGTVWLAVNQTPASLLSLEEVAQAKARLLNPLEVVRVIWYSYTTHGEALWRSLIGILGWLDTPLPMSLYVLYTAIFVGMLVFGCEARFDDGWRVRLGALAGLVFIPSILCLVLYLNWSHENYAAGGLQGRYYLAALPLLCVCCAKPAGWRWNPLTHIRRFFPWGYETMVLSVVAGGLCVSVFSLWSRYYI